MITEIDLTHASVNMVEVVAHRFPNKRDRRYGRDHFEITFGALDSMATLKLTPEQTSRLLYELAVEVWR